MFKTLMKNESGQGMSEYLILVLLIAVGSIAAAKTVGQTIYTKLDTIHDKIRDVHFGDAAHGKGETE